jgi:copper oxidase (laccase) domain-containing protein
VADVVGAAVARLSELAGGSAELVAAIGPHISAAAFEVGEEVALELDRAAPGNEVVRREPGRKPHVDLRRALRAQLRRVGLRDEAIDDVGGCTVGEPELYFSYRRDGPRSGRHLSAIVSRSG